LVGSERCIRDSTKKWEYDSDNALRVTTSSKPADNYLLIPQLSLKAGETYTVTIQAAAYSTSYTSETMEVVAGSAPTVEALTQVVVENTSVLGGNQSGEYLTYEGTLTAPAEGTCYLAIHATTPENGGYLYIKSIKISKGMGERAPGAVTEFTATAAADGAHTVELSFKLPAVDLSGDALDALTKAVILRDNDTIATLTTDLTPGKAVTYTDNAESLTGGKHVYTVVCANESGEGSEAKAEAFVGFASPVAVASVSMTEPTEGHVVATWEPVTADVDGRTLTADDVTYNVYKYLAGEKYPVAQNVKGTTYEYDPFEDFEHDGSQRFVQTLIEAVTEGGSSKIVPSLNTPVGKSYTAPWAESFADCKTKSIFANLTVSGTDVWRPAAEDDFGTKPADNDGGMIAFEGYGRAACTLMSGKIDLADVLEPAVSMQVYNFGSGATNENILEVSVRAAGDAQFTKIFSTKISEVGPKQEWSKVIVPLSDYAGQTVQIAFTAYNNEYSWTHIDDIKVTSNASHNLSVNTFKAPVSVEPGAEFTLSAEIENVGLEDAKGFKVNLLCDEDIVDTKTIALLATNNKTSVTFKHSFSIFETGTHAFAVELDYALDMLDTDNSAELEVVVRTNTLPTVTDLAAEPADNGAKLTWSAPAGAKAKVATTENFDAAYIGWKSEIEGWTFLDLDRGFIGGIGSKQLPVSGRQSFFVFNNTLSALQNGNIAAFAAHSGNQFLCSMYSTIGDNMVQSDDWAITPELSGEPQVISLYASSFQSDPGETQYLETFQLLYSTTDTDPESFTLIEEYVKIPATWREYKAYVPEGTKYFAIRCVSYNQYMLFIDDVKYVAKNAATESVTPAAYNIYRDGLKLNDEPVAANTFIDETIDHKSTYKYHVSALYDATESLPSNEVIYDSTKSGVDAVGYDTVTISTSAGVITVAGAEGADITVVAADGKVIAAEKGLAVNRFNVQPGIYIVKAADTVVKVSVR
ncbi:MAG: choice-of-anchor J domain-containing protein, partial [Muribaculaceae bacterium]|nr:choice-of-anchor J domain-containing protein [Muribaculaceae bacterium]